MKLLILSFGLLLVSCGIENTERTEIKQTTSSCVVEQLESGAAITCPDGSTAVINNGIDGVDGKRGKKGIDGSSCDVEDTPGGAIIVCDDGSVVINDGKVKTINTEPVYEGYFCGRTVVRIGSEKYVINWGLVLLTKQWYKIGSCEIRLENRQIKVQY